MIHLRQLLAELDVDGVLSAAQARRRSGVEIVQLTEQELVQAGLFVFPLRISRVFRGDVSTFNFVARRPLDRYKTPSQIIHEVGTAEMRAAIRGIQTGSWVSSASALAATSKPDAELTLGGQTYAIEYDTGSYSSQRVEDKLKAFGPYTHVFWGCSSLVRTRRLQERYRTQARLTVFHVAWWAPRQSEAVDAPSPVVNAEADCGSSRGGGGRSRFGHLLGALPFPGAPGTD